MKKERTAYFEWLRVFAAFAVVVMHTEGKFWMSISHESREWLVLTAWDGLVRWPVPVFIMITGALFLPRKTELRTVLMRYIPRMLAAWTLWSGVYILHGLYSGTAVDVLSEFLSGHYHMWYIPFLVGVYLTLPFLQKITEDRKLTGELLAVSGVIALLIPWLADVVVLLFPGISGPVRTLEGNLNFAFFFDHLAILLLGHVLCQTELTKKQRGVLYVLGIFGAVVTAPATIWASRYSGFQSSVFCDIAAPNNLLTAAALFVFAKYHLTRLPKAVEWMARHSFGVYLVHVLIIEVLAQLGFDALHQGVAAVSAAVFAISLAVSALLRKLPVIGKYIV